MPRSVVRDSLCDYQSDILDSGSLNDILASSLNCHRYSPGTTIKNTLSKRDFQSWRRPLAGLLIFIMLVLTIVAGLSNENAWLNFLTVAGICGWLAAMLLFVDTPTILRIQVGIIILVGLMLGFYAISIGGSMDTDTIISGNAGLLTMVAAVGFLRLVALPSSSTTEQLPIGPKAYLQTLLGLNISSSVINISALILVADRIHQFRPLQRFTSKSLTRVFSAASNWSPFFAAMAVVLSYVGDAQLSWIISVGLPFTILCISVVLLEARFRHKSETDEFVGFPMHLQSITIPLLLVITVALGTWIMPAVSVLVVIALSALLITLIVLMLRNNLVTAFQQIGHHIVEGLPRTVNELTLFLAAGLIAAGMSAMIQQGIVPNPFSEFNAITAAKLLGIMLLLAAMGIHPVILISSFTPLMLTLNPDPNLLAITYLMAWNLGTCSSPLSGTHLVVQGRYGIPSWKAAMWNWPYAFVMYGFAVLWLQLVEMYFL